MSDPLAMQALRSPTRRGSVDLGAPDAFGVARLTLSNPGKMNALSVSMWGALRAAAAALTEAVSSGAAPRAVVVSGAQGQFAAGADIAEFPAFRFDAQALAHYHEDIVAPALQALLDCDVPLIAQIEGACVGGGLQIAACCDLRIAGAGSRFGVPIARLGFPMAPREVEIVAAAIGPALLRELLLEARLLDAATALARGLLTRVVADDAVAAEAQATARRVAQLSPMALRLNKQGLRRHAAGPADDAAARRARFGFAGQAEHREGIAAFLARREPDFTRDPPT